MRKSFARLLPDAPLADLQHHLLQEDQSFVAVVDAAGRYVGLLSKADLLQRLLMDEAPSDRVADWLQAGCRALPPSAPLGQAAATMAGEGLHRLPIVDATGILRGVVVAQDVVHLMAGALPG